MNDPLRFELEVACGVEHAFSTWTSGIATWWPADHTVSGSANSLVVLECEPGGRIYEKTVDGTEHDWGTVTRFEPPGLLAYRWHIGADPADASEVEVRFLARGESRTLVEIEHRGWERLGASAEALRDRNRSGWETLLPHFGAALSRGGA